MTKDERKYIAQEHNQYMIKNFSKSTKNSVYGSVIYNNSIKSNYVNTKIDISIIDSTTEQCIFNIYNDNISKEICVLNFASYKYPGGGFMNGSIAQEEALCHNSNLYNILSSDRFKQFYNNNREHTNNGLYSDFGIFSPEVVFLDESNNVYSVNVFTAAAPNLSGFKTPYNNETKELIDNAVYNRIKFILDAMEKEMQKVLILGAFGCGVFKNNPYHIARVFRDLLLKGNYSFETVIFAIPGGQNYTAFKEIFEKPE